METTFITAMNFALKFGLLALMAALCMSEKSLDDIISEAERETELLVGDLRNASSLLTGTIDDSTNHPIIQNPKEFIDGSMFQVKAKKAAEKMGKSSLMN